MTPQHIMQTKEALRHGAAEIERLRRENEMLAIKANAFDTFAAFVLLVSPKQYATSAPDAVWILRKLLAEIEAEEAKAPRAEPEEGA